MAGVEALSLTDFRCFRHRRIDFFPRCNLVVGPNASGKTAILEALWLLATGRSFRSARLQHLVRHEADEAVIFARVDGHRLGWAREGKRTVLRRDGQTVRRQAELSACLPLQLMTPDSHRLLAGSPQARRQFMDWGGFYHYETFIRHWRSYRRALRQRNQALRAQVADGHMAGWEAVMAESGEALHGLRQRYVMQLAPVVVSLAKALMPELSGALTLRLLSGWRQELTLADALAQGRRRDRQLGATQAGPHRSELQIRIDGREASEILSRGQQKLLVGALLLAQVELLRQRRQRTAAMLVDDLPAELDRTHRARLLGLLDELAIQYVVTTADRGLIHAPPGANEVVL